MNRYSQILLLTLIFPIKAQAYNPQNTDSNDFALSCIQLNKDMNLASKQMLETEMNKAHLKSKINYLQDETSKRRNIIEDLDKKNNQENNNNYNQLVTQFEDLLEERKQTINLYNEQHQLHVAQYDSVVRLEQRFSNNCLQQVQITKELYKDVCQFEDVRWCKAFSFSEK